MESGNEVDRRPVAIVTGSSGFLGRHISRELSKTHLVVGLDTKEPAPKSDALDWFECDLTSDMQVRKVFEKIAKTYGTEVDLVLHLAAFYDFSGKPNHLYQALTVNGTKRVVHALRDFDVSQFIFSSSLLVMKPLEDEQANLSEESPLKAEWAYPRSKLAAEAVLETAGVAFPIVILRLAGVYTDVCDSLPLSQHIRRIYEKQFESHFFPGDTSHGQPFVHLDDVAGCVRSAIDSRERLDAYERFLIAEPECLSHRDLQDILGSLIHGEAWATVRVPKVAAKAGAWLKDLFTTEEQFIQPWMIDMADAEYSVSIKSAAEKLDWRPRQCLRHALPLMIAALRKDPRWWYARHGLSLPSFLQTATHATTQEA